MIWNYSKGEWEKEICDTVLLKTLSQSSYATDATDEAGYEDTQEAGEDISTPVVEVEDLATQMEQLEITQNAMDEDVERYNNI